MIIKAKCLLGAPVMGVEMTDEQFEQAYLTAEKDWNLYSSKSIFRRGKMKSIKEDWTERYFHALCKEVLSRIRGKFKGKLPLPGANLTLEFEDLAREAWHERQNLISLVS